MLDIILNYFLHSSAITLIVLLVLSIYLVIAIWIFSYKNTQLTNLIDVEKVSLERLKTNNIIDSNSILEECASQSFWTKEIFNSHEISCIREVSSGASWLSIISSTAPFIGLFGTVTGILESFAKFSTHSKVSFSVIAPAISEALVATASGILVAIFAYTFHQIVSRKIYEFNTYLTSQSQMLLSKK
ncbi:MotA/TolQ/ExbB proton channel family protein [hydrothermal vent metagenome]|uniref:MotA/TolQ/ExbB proton channel family protein n=1 Tax=hydrothermal vent metagenome TaxID=652676 RepID=A0A3B1E5L4_9ZZZZ